MDKVELRVYLETLKTFGCLDWSHDKKTFEVLPFTRERVLETAYKIFESSAEISSLERALPALLEFCLLRPRLSSEVKEFLSNYISEQETTQLLNIVEHFRLLGTEVVLGKFELLYYNEYQFGDKDKAAQIGVALATLSKKDEQELNALIEEVSQKPGVLPDSIRVSEEIKSFAIGLGLVDESEVFSPAGTAKFLTLPRLPLPSVGTEKENLENDIFHHSKMLLSSLRFGELRSEQSRGRINDPVELISALLEKDRIGPCTAIGEDYTILETEGVIRTIHAEDKPGNQFFMELRRREPAEIVLALLESGSSGVLDSGNVSRSIELPLQFTSPEVTRPLAAKQTARNNPELMKRFLEELRT